jgi:hypothetical protein
MQKIDAILSSSSNFSAEELGQLRQEIFLLHQDYNNWPEHQPDDWRPNVIGFVQQNPEELAGTIYWPGKVETYYDLYVAAVWNAYRKARLLFLQRIFNLRTSEPHCAGPCSETAMGMLIRLQRDARALAIDIAASVPFHLTSRPYVAPNVHSPGRPVGGLLLLHPLYVASTLHIVPQELQNYFRRCLAWIGNNMAIGQASLLAKVPEPQRSVTYLTWSR